MMIKFEGKHEQIFQKMLRILKFKHRKFMRIHKLEQDLQRQMDMESEEIKEFMLQSQ